MIHCGITGSNGVLGKKIRKVLPYKFHCFKKDITNYYDVKKWINQKKLDLVIHLAALVPTKEVNKNYIRARKINVIGTKNLVKSIINAEYKPKWFFFSSSSHVYNISYKDKKINEKELVKPSTRYGLTKKDAELVVKKNFKKRGIIFCIGRIFSFTDTRQKQNYVIPNLIKQIKLSKKKEITLKNLNHYRDFISMENISKIINILLKKKYVGFVNIGSGKKIYLKDIAKIILKKYNKKGSFIDNKNPTYLIADIRKLKKITKINFKSNIKNMIFSKIK